jgi:hypothetical protein
LIMARSSAKVRPAARVRIRKHSKHFFSTGQGGPDRVSDALVGVSVMPLDNRRDVLVGVATTAERLATTATSLPETWALRRHGADGRGGGEDAAHRAGHGHPGRVGTQRRHPRHGRASTLAAISGGRFVLGLGASTAPAHRGAPRRAVRGADRPDAAAR